MARAIWKGHISFGLINIPVTLTSAEQKFDLSFRMIDSRNKAVVRYERINDVTGEEVPWNKVVKGYEYKKNNYVLLTDEDFKHADLKAFQSIEIEDFVDRDAVAFMYFEKPYYLAPQKKAEKGYVLLREVLRNSNKMGIAKVVIRTRQYICAIYPCCDVLVLNILRYNQALRGTSGLDLPGRNLKPYHVSPKEIEMAEKFIDSMTTTWNPSKYRDDYHDHLLKWIEKKAKAHGEPIVEKEEPEEETDGNNVDMLELLKQSMKGGGRDGHHQNGHHKIPAQAR
jgi:DNA end-binding protein Ku